MSFSEANSSGILLPFYAEEYDYSVNQEKAVSLPRQNFVTYFLFALRTRIRTSPIAASELIETGAWIDFSWIKQEKYIQIAVLYNQVHHEDSLKPRVGLDYLPLLETEISASIPSWFEEVVDAELDSHFNYAVLLSDKYALRPSDPDCEPPLWWLQTLLPRLPWRQLIEEALATSSEYDVFVQDDRVYINMISNSSENVSRNSGISSVPAGTRILEDAIEGGTTALAYRDLPDYGDYAHYYERFEKIQLHAIAYILRIFDQGALPLFSDDSLIARWNLVPLVHYAAGRFEKVNTFYIPAWEDIRITGYDGVFKTLYRQSEYMAGTVEANLVYFYSYDKNWIVYNLANKVQEIIPAGTLIMDNAIAVMTIADYKTAVQIADLIEELRDSATVKMVKQAVSETDSTAVGKYYDLQRKTFVVISISS